MPKTEKYDVIATQVRRADQGAMETARDNAFQVLRSGAKALDALPVKDLEALPEDLRKRIVAVRRSLQLARTLAHDDYTLWSRRVGASDERRAKKREQVREEAHPNE